MSGDLYPHEAHSPGSDRHYHQVRRRARVKKGTIRVILPFVHRCGRPRAGRPRGAPGFTHTVSEQPKHQKWCAAARGAKAAAVTAIKKNNEFLFAACNKRAPRAEPDTNGHSRERPRAQASFRPSRILNESVKKSTTSNDEPQQHLDEGHARRRRC